MNLLEESIVQKGEDGERDNGHVDQRQGSPLSMSQAMVNSYQLYIQSPPTNNIPMYYEREIEDSDGKKRRTNYKNPENSAKLSAAINMLLNQVEDSNGLKDIKAISKMFNIPYNTLRDNYLRVTTGQAPKSKRVKKPSSRNAQAASANVYNYPIPTMEQLQYMQQMYGLPPQFLHNQAFPNYPAGLNPARQMLESTYHSSGNNNVLNSAAFTFAPSDGGAGTATSSSRKRSLEGDGGQQDSDSDSGEDDDVVLESNLAAAAEALEAPKLNGKKK